ncbi:hypothetical protein F383_29195 [Gossypium arboreum]|uniref:Uncharacterized protein n=1 Tax=Gossypium arboreum TaxID=29729 RepID=A0A0B0MYT4_GOSAR|nr:hypothetical protein F383_29195 [Gossypium arboreum]
MASHMPVCETPVCHTRPVDTPVCLGRVKTVRYTALIRKGTPGDTRSYNMTMCRTQLRHTLVSLPCGQK